MKGLNYILTNEAMPGFIKIGITTPEGLQSRLNSLNTTGIPLPFKLHYAVVVSDENIALQIEKKLHLLFSNHRVNPKREFFQLDPERAVLALELLVIVGNAEEYTTKTEVYNDEENYVSTRRQSKICLSKIGLKPGDIITFSRDETITATVIDDKKIMFRNEETSLSGAASKLLPYGVSGPAVWMYDGETLAERRLRIEQTPTFEAIEIV